MFRESMSFTGRLLAVYRTLNKQVIKAKLQLCYINLDLPPTCTSYVFITK